MTHVHKMLYDKINIKKTQLLTFWWLKLRSPAFNQHEHCNLEGQRQLYGH